jgi:aspartate racemase
MIEPKHIGILAHSADGAALCFLEMVRESAIRLGPHEHPEITLSILPMGPTLGQYESGDLDGIRRYLARTVDRLASAGCDFFVCPDNTAHIALERPGAQLGLPGLHIAALVAERAQRDGRKRVGLLGTKWTMEGSSYPTAFKQVDIELVTPPPADRAMVDDVIFSELCRGVLRTESRAHYIRVIDQLRLAGCDAVALGGTEIPLLVTPEVSPLPTLDSTRLLALGAVETALSARIPRWRGGPLSYIRAATSFSS